MAAMSFNRLIFSLLEKAVRRIPSPECQRSGHGHVKANHFTDVGPNEMKPFSQVTLIAPHCIMLKCADVTYKHTVLTPITCLMRKMLRLSAL